MSTPATPLSPVDEVDAARVLLAEKTTMSMPALSSVVLIHHATVHGFRHWPVWLDETDRYLPAASHPNDLSLQGTLALT